MKLSKQSIQAVANIKGHFDQIEKDFNQLTNEEQEQVFAYHNENYNLNHCLRWGQQAAREILRNVKPEEEIEIEVGDDLEAYLSEHLEGIVEGHLEAWKDRYHRKKLEDVVFDLRVNYDSDAEIKNLEEQIGREMTDDERSYFYDVFIKEVENSFYL
ncbi:hypothetical protein ACFVS2_20415 [Brevibacillus sp. NPDC058079]|uniref:hypothetical protein n=1 Tax=Brevibacillus sp. NPDC058079 TaxID=3346330 RepID=UPI0036EE78BE